MEMKKSMCLEEKLVLLRKEQGLSQTAAAERLEISRQAISRWEMGSAVPTAENLKCLSELYQVPVDVLLDDSRDIHTWREEQRRRQTEPEQSDHKTERKRAAVNRRTAVIALAAAAGIGAGIFIGAVAVSGEEATEFTSIDDMEQERPLDSDAEKFSFD